MVMSSDEEYERLVGQSRKQDDAAVPILKPDNTRQEYGMHKLFFGGGPRPTNTLKTSPYFYEGNEPQTTSSKSRRRNGAQPSAPKSHSCSSNPSTPPNDSLSDLRTSASRPQKRRKTEHKSDTPSDSVVSVSSLPDGLPPDSVKFKSKTTRSEDTATLGMDVRYPDNEQTFGDLSVFRKVQRLFDSKPHTEKHTESSRIATSKQPSQQGGQRRLGRKMHATKSSHRSPMRQTKQDNQTDITATYKISVNFPEKPPDSTGNLSRANPFTPQCEEDKSDGLSNKFRTTKGERRGISASSNQDSVSSDELGGSTKKRGRSTSPGRPVSPGKAPSRSGHPMEPSNIKPTAFHNSRRGRKRFKRSPDTDSEAEETPYWRVPVKAINIPGRADILAVDDVSLVWRATDASFLLTTAGESSAFPCRTKIQPKKLQKCVWEQGGGKIRLEHSRDSCETDHILELQLTSEKDVIKLLQKIQDSYSVKTMAVESERMDKIFRHSREERHTSIANMRRNDSIPDDIQMASLNHSRRLQKPCEMNESTQHDRSVKLVSELASRSREFEPSHDPRSIMIDRASVSTGPIVSHSRGGQAISNLFKRQPEHNSHLRRSTRHSGAQSRLLEDPLDMPAEPEPERYSKIHGLGSVWRRPLSYPKVGKKKATVEFEDLERLDEGQFLNDNLISFYLRYLEHKLEKELPGLSGRVYFFNTFFYERLMSPRKGHKGINYEGVQKWTRTIDLFTYDFVIVPINELSHWYVAVICNLPALDRRMALSEEPGSQPQGEVETATGLVERNFSSAFQHSTLESPERETTNSFAEMTLEGKPQARQVDDQKSLPPSGDDEGQRVELKDNQDDGEMLDVPSIPKKTSQANTAQAQPMILDLERLSDPIEDPDDGDGEKVVPLRTRQKRKSAPIMCRNPDLPAIITFDSLDNPHSHTVKVLKQYLVEEGKAKRGGMQFDEGQIKGVTAKGIPLQSNYSDCGLFMLGYVEKMLSIDPREFISKIIKREYDVDKDWPRLVPSNMRTNIREQLQELHEIDQDERRELAKKAGKYHVVKPSTETPQHQVSVSQQPTSRGKTNAANSTNLKDSAQDDLLPTNLSEKAPGNDDLNRIKTQNRGSEKNPPIAEAVGKSEPSNTENQSVIIVESEPQTQQAEQPPSSLPPDSTVRTLSLAHTMKSFFPLPAEIPESQPQSQSCSPSQSKNLAEGCSPFTTEHSQGSEVTINGLPDLNREDVKPIDRTPVSPSRTRGTKRPSKMVEAARQRTSPRSNISKTTTPVIYID